MTGSPAQLDELLSSPTRLAVVALLAGAEWAEFGYVRDSVAVTDSALSKQITVLSGHGYLEIRKGHVGRRPRTWLNITDTGRRALHGHVAALQAIVDRAAMPPS